MLVLKQKIYQPVVIWRAIHGNMSVKMSINRPYDQFLLFGDSITQQSGCQDLGFAFAPALQDGKHLSPILYSLS
jgi:hypothetical protein